MNRLEKKFGELRRKNKKALITYITGGHPSIEHTEELIYAQIRGGADIVEIGIPFSDPLADGPVIQKAAQCALEGGITLDKIFQCIKKVRKNVETPLVFLVYFNSVLAYGMERFAAMCQEVGIDGLVIPDLPMEEHQELLPHIQNKDVALIPLIAPTSGERIPELVYGAKGFIYCISSLGVTGSQGSFYRKVEDFLQSIRKHTDVPLAVGFGISTPEDIQRLRPYVDGVIVGSALVRKVEESQGNPEVVEEFVRSLCSE